MYRDPDRAGTCVGHLFVGRKAHLLEGRRPVHRNAYGIGHPPWTCRQRGRPRRREGKPWSFFLFAVFGYFPSPPEDRDASQAGSATIDYSGMEIELGTPGRHAFSYDTTEFMDVKDMVSSPPVLYKRENAPDHPRPPSGIGHVRRCRQRRRPALLSLYRGQDRALQGQAATSIVPGAGESRIRVDLSSGVFHLDARKSPGGDGPP